MPIKVCIHDPLTGEDGSPLFDPENVLHRLADPDRDEQFRLLSRIDWYDTTDFRGPQVLGLLAEIDSKLVGGLDAGETSYLRRLRELTAKCAESPRHWLRFYGD